MSQFTIRPRSQTTNQETWIKDHFYLNIKHSGYKYGRRTRTFVGYEYVNLGRMRIILFSYIFDWQKLTYPLSATSTGDVLQPFSYEFEYISQTYSW